jgi:dipeptidyl aminopeptidase/acylaminoacyl peptidase
MKHCAVIRFLVVAHLFGCSIHFTESSAANSATPIVPRAAFLLETDKDNPGISPNGAFVSFTATSTSAVELWIAPSTSLRTTKRIATIEEGALSGYYWTSDSSRLLCLVDGKDGSYRLDSIEIQSGRRRNLLVSHNRISFFGASPSRSSIVVIGVSHRAAKWPDVYTLDVNTGKLKLVLRNESFSNILIDRDLRPVIGLGSDGKNNTLISALSRNGDHRSLFMIPADPYQPSSVIQVDAVGKVLYMLDARGRNTTALVTFDIASGKSSVLCEDARTDIRRAFFDPVTGQPLMCLAEYGSYSWTALDDSVRGDIAFLNSRMKGYWAPAAASSTASKWIVYSDGMTNPSRYMVYDRKSHTLEDFYLTTPGLAGASLATTFAVQIPARDGLPLVAYLTLPKESDPRGEGRPEHPLPLVLLIHGGPWGRAYQRLYVENQLFANRGYAVLAVQFRGSTGFGRKFTSASFKEWGGAMQDDLLDSVAWAIGNGIGKSGKIAAYGRSYGGYAALMGVLKSPEVFSCGVDISGPSDLASFVANADEGDRVFWSAMIGDPNNSEDLAMLHARSPVFAPEKLARPLLMIQGGRDTTVPKAGSDLMASKLEKEGAHFTYVVYPDEGHFFSKLEDRESTLALSEQFLANCLGGRSEPLGDLAQYELQIRYGQQYVGDGMGSP